MPQRDVLQALDAARASVRSLTRGSRAHAELASILGGLGRRSEGLAELAGAAALAPGRAEDYEALAFAAFGLGAHELSRAFYSRVTEMAPGDATAWYNLATSDRNLGDLVAAEAACERTLALDDGFVQAALLRSQLRTQSADRNHLDDLRERLGRLQSSPAARMFLGYALGKELDDIGDHDQAFRFFALGAKARREALAYDVREDLGKLARIRQAFGAERLAGAPAAGAAGGFGFILGLPRSGTTMIERVMTGHPDAVSNGETDNLLAALMEGADRGAGDVFDQVAAADPAVVAQAYARRARRDGFGLVLEKLPMNYLYAGAIRLAMPGARIVLVSRSAGDNAFAMFSTLFGAGYPFSYDLRELGAYLVGYHHLLRHWKSTLGTALMEVRYEDFVEAPAALGPGVAGHLGVDWRPDMVRIENNRSASATASAVQVRRPIYRSAVGRWRPYAAHLAPLLEVLGAAGIVPDAALGGD